MLYLIALLGLNTLLALTLQKTYARLPLKELKRRARTGETSANILFRAASHGGGLQMLLWLIASLSASGFFILLALNTSFVWALSGSFLLIWVAFVWLPNSRLSGFSTTVSRWLSPPVAWVLNFVATPLDRLARFFAPPAHTGLFQKDDLTDLLHSQKNQPDNRIPAQELDIAVHALTYGDKLVRQIMTPRRKVKQIAVTDHIGPVLLSELHDSGHSRFPVYQGKADNIVGTLYIRDLVSAKSSGRVSEFMSKEVYYVHEEQTLNQALQAFIKTKHHLYIVVNSFEEMVGVLTIEDILKQIIGKPLVEDFDQFDDRKAVAQIAQPTEKEEPEKIETKK